MNVNNISDRSVGGAVKDIVTGAGGLGFKLMAGQWSYRTVLSTACHSCDVSVCPGAKLCSWARHSLYALAYHCEHHQDLI